MANSIYMHPSAFQLNFNFTMKQSNGNYFHVTGPLWGESTGHRLIPLTKVSDADRWCFLWSAPEQTVEQTIETPVIWDAIALIITSVYYEVYYSALRRADGYRYTIVCAWT